MTKEELFHKYNIDDSHANWDESIDNRMSVEIYRIMHNGELPPPDDKTCKWVLDFLDKAKSDIKWWAENVMVRKDWGSLFLTAKRLAHSLHMQLIIELGESTEISPCFSPPSPGMLLVGCDGLGKMTLAEMQKHNSNLVILDDLAKMRSDPFDDFMKMATRDRLRDTDIDIIPKSVYKEFTPETPNPKHHNGRTNDATKNRKRNKQAKKQRKQNRRK